MSGDMSGRVPVLRARSDAALSGRRRRRVPGREPGPGARRGAGRAGRQRAGKSSLLRVLAGLQAPSAGALDMEGQRLAGVHPRVAVAFQDPGLLPWLTLERNVAFGLDFKHQPALDARERARRVDLAIEEVGLSHARQLRPAQLSGGMAQRTALARCLARQPAVLLLDEPFGALDEVTRAEMQTLLRKVVADVGAAALLITTISTRRCCWPTAWCCWAARPAACWANGPWTCRSRAPTCCPKWARCAWKYCPACAARAAGRTRRPNRRYLFDPSSEQDTRSLGMCLEHMSRRDWLKLTALLSAGGAASLLSAFNARAQAEPDAPVRIGYLPITDAAPLLVAHNNGLFDKAGVKTEAHAAAQLGAGDRGLHLGTGQRGAPAVAHDRLGALRQSGAGQGGGLEPRRRLGPDGDAGDQQRQDLGGKTVAIPFWYSIHNVVLQYLLRENGLTPVSRRTARRRRARST